MTEEVYMQQPERTTGGIAGRSVIAKAKARVPVIDLADRLIADSGDGPWRKSGGNWTARCPLPGHDDKTPSFVVYRDNERGWHCFGCQRGGDVVNLAQLAWGYDRADSAAADVLHTFGHEIPPRRPTWYAKNKRQGPIRAGIDAARFEQVRRRLYRKFMRPLVEGVEDAADRAHDEQVLWEATDPLALMLLDGLSQRERAA